MKKTLTFTYSKKDVYNAQFLHVEGTFIKWPLKIVGISNLTIGVLSLLALKFDFYTVLSLCFGIVLSFPKVTANVMSLFSNKVINRDDKKREIIIDNNKIKITNSREKREILWKNFVWQSHDKNGILLYTSLRSLIYIPNRFLNKKERENILEKTTNTTQSDQLINEKAKYALIFFATVISLPAITIAMTNPFTLLIAIVLLFVTKTVNNK